MSWGARCVVVAVVMSAAMSVTVGAAPVASAATTGTATLETVLLYDSTTDLCAHYEVRYTGGAEANNVTIGGDTQLSGDNGYETYCPPSAPDVGVVDTGATITTSSPGCVAAGSAAKCSPDALDLTVIVTGPGDDSIRVGPLPGTQRTHISAGSGNDAIRALNGQADIISCGYGNNDVVIADTYDQIDSDCEVVQFQD